MRWEALERAAGEPVGPKVVVIICLEGSQKHTKNLEQMGGYLLFSDAYSPPEPQEGQPVLA